MGVSGALSGLRYVCSELREHYDDTRWWRGRIRNRVVSPIHTNVYPGYRGSVRVMEEDWDNLFVLDACRADAFERVADLDSFDAYERVKSLGSATPEWTRRNFSGRRFGDTVYVSANPHTTRLAGDSFHRLVEVWKEAFDEDLGTVPPEDVKRAALDAVEPDKRLIVHFIQPHPPFIRSPIGYTDVWVHEFVPGATADGLDVWQALRSGEVGREEVLRAYEADLELVLDTALELADELDGKTVISADHGTLLGERLWPVPIREYSHVTGLRNRPLVTVPWAVVDGNRRSVVDDGTNPVDVDEDAVGERLSALGYLDEASG